MIDAGSPYIENIINFKDIKFTAESILAIHQRKVSLGEFISHLLPINNVTDINVNMSIIIGEDFLNLLKQHPASERNPQPLGQVFPEMIGGVEDFFRLRHLYAHELATKEPVSVRKIESCMSSMAIFIVHTEELTNQQLLPIKGTK